MRAFLIAAAAFAIGHVAAPKAEAQAASGQAVSVSKPLPSKIEVDAALFVLEEFLDGGNSVEKIETFYGEYVFYFDQGVRSREQVMEDKRIYIGRWPDRVLTPDLSTLETRPVPGGDGRVDVEVKVEIDFDVSGPGRTANGRATVALLLAERGGGFIVLSEGGRVISR